MQGLGLGRKTKAQKPHTFLEVLMMIPGNRDMHYEVVFALDVSLWSGWFNYNHDSSSLKTITPKAWTGVQSKILADSDQLASRFIPGKGCQQVRLQPEGKIQVPALQSSFIPVD